MIPAHTTGLLCFCLALVGNFATAQAETIFQRAEGLYGSVNTPSQSCETNPHRLAFTDGNRRALVTLSHPIDTRVGRATTFGYEVVGHDAGSISMRLDGETLRQPNGAPVVWVLRLTPSKDGYCWGRTDWPGFLCVSPSIRCAPQSPAA